MPKKVSELNLNLDEVLDDETGLSLAELKKRMKENTTSFNKGQEKLKEYERTLQEREAALQQAMNQLQQWNAWYQSQQARGAGPASPPAEDWRADPLYQPVAQELDQLRNALATIVRAYANFLQDYNTRWQAAYQWANQREVERLKSLYPDFDEEAVRAVAVKHQIPTWEGAYQAWKAERVPDLLAQKEQEIREKALQEAKEKLHAPPTEMGGGPPGPPVAEPPKEYGDAWKGLVQELQGLGLS